MPEHFFHIRLDIAGHHSKHIDRSGKARIFATPPQLDGSLSLARSYGLSLSKPAGSNDWRAGKILVQSVDMVPTATSPLKNNGTTTPQAASATTQQASLAKRFASSQIANTATKARFEPSDVHEAEAGWGVVRLFRDSQETPGLYEDVNEHRHCQPDQRGIASYAAQHLDGHHAASSSATSNARGRTDEPFFKDEDCTTLCILAVPSYMSPSDLLGWVGEKTRDAVSHFRLLRTERANRYMVLMRFRAGRRAREWRKEWNGKLFDAAEPETAHVVFVKSVEFVDSSSPPTDGSFPDLTSDPFTSTAGTKELGLGSTKGAVPLNSKPVPPPTPSLVEMPTCPVCLERMDESTGLLTILCQHVFHCSCLSKWRGSGCPVCRFTHDGLSGRRLHAPPSASTSDHTYAANDGPNECSICRSEANLWICLICGNVGCGRYDAAHAFLHWQHSGHAFSMDMGTQRIWDYARDAYVHRIVQNKLDGKIVEMPAAAGSDGNATGPSEDEGLDREGDYIPRAKSDAIEREYTALLTSQLESQRLYFEGKVSLVADKASQASQAATQAAEAASKALDELARLKSEHSMLAGSTIPSLEKERDRANRRADKAQEMARKFEKEWREEKIQSDGLAERVKKVKEDMEVLKRESQGLKDENAELKDMNRDLQFFISSQEKLKEMGDEVADGTLSLPEEQRKKARGRKGKAKGFKSEDS